MSDVLEIPEAGMITVKFAGGEFRLDAYDLYNDLIEARARNADADGGIRGFHLAAGEVLTRHGLPTLNHFQIDRFVTALERAVETLKKTPEHAPTPNSPDFSGSAS